MFDPKEELEPLLTSEEAESGRRAFELDHLMFVGMKGYCDARYMAYQEMPQNITIHQLKEALGKYCSYNEDEKNAYIAGWRYYLCYEDNLLTSNERPEWYKES